MNNPANSTTDFFQESPDGRATSGLGDEPLFWNMDNTPLTRNLLYIQ